MPLPGHHRRAAAVYLLLALIYLLYLPHAQFVADDWFVLGRYQTVRDDGAGAQVRMVTSIIQNRFHGQFRFQWVSFLLGWVLWLIVGYSPKVVFSVSLLLHAGCAIALRRALLKLRIGAQTAFLSGAIFVLLPSTHGPVFWSFNCMFFLWSSFWFFLYLGSLAGSVEARRLDGKAAARQAVFLLLALFSGDPIIGLLAAAAPLTAWFLRSGVALRAALLAWGTVGAAGTFYALVINKAAMVTSGVGLRYAFTPGQAWANLASIAQTYRKLTGLTEDSYYQLQATPPAILAAVIAVAAVVACLRGTPKEAAGFAHGRARTLVFAGGLWLAAYGPILFLRGHEFRYDYVPSPYLALALSTALLSLSAVRVPLAAVCCGWLAAVSVADVEQSWVPQSRSLRAVAEKLRSVHPLQRGDLIILSNIREWIGTAPHFAFLAGWASTPFAEHVTGVRGVEAALEIVNEGGKLRVLHRDYMRDLKPGEPSRTRVLVAARDASEPPMERRLMAHEVRPGAYRLHALMGYTGPPVPELPFTQEQLAMFGGKIYLAESFSHEGHAGHSHDPR